MEDYQYKKFSALRRKFKKYIEIFPGDDDRVVPVYNCDLDKFKKGSSIKYILIGDNPGEQERILNRYLIGKAGQTARNFFQGSGLVESFDEEVLVLNKTFLHTKSTIDLKMLMKESLLKGQLEQSQRFMANLAFDLHLILGCELWITGCSEIRPKGIFEQFRESMNSRYSGEEFPRGKFLCFKHFSYGNFTRDLNSEEGGHTADKLEAIGVRMREKTFGW